MRNFNKFGPFGCGRIKAALRFSLNVSGCVLILTLGGRLSGSLGVLSNSDIVEIVSGVGRLWGLLGSRLVVGEAQAAICFLPDCMDKADQVLSGNLSSRYCKDLGYVYYPLGQCPQFYARDVCPYDSYYLKCDAAQWCRDNGYETKVEDCTVPEYADEKCPNGQEVYKRCKADYEQACTEEDPDYVSECQEGWILDENELCSYSEMYGKCCNLCSDYPYEEDEIPEGYVKGDSCNACGNVTRYKIEPNPCIGYQKCTDTPKSGTPECKHGNETWYKECCAYECSLAECPEGTDCNFEVCSSKYCIVGCLVDYTDYCQKPVTDCAALGYTSTSCGGRKLVCPYDSGLFFCM